MRLSRAKMQQRLFLGVWIGTCLASASFESSASLASEPAASARQAAATIDEFLTGHWAAHDTVPAEPIDDAGFLRRVTLDLAGRIPTAEELEQFLNDDSKNKRDEAIARLVDGPEFPLHFGSVLDQMIQTRHAGNPQFVDYLRRSLRDAKPWDRIFREIMLGPWDRPELKPANRFLDKRAKTLDVLTVDTARVFFGVDISCAHCHDHPLVDDWTQAHFYGLAAFLNRTTGGKGKVGEAKEGEVTYVAADGSEQTARMMFLSGRLIDEPESDSAGASGNSPVSRRRQLVDVALEEQRFLSRSMVNRMWGYFFGRALVEPVDQMHSANDPAVPGLLEWLAEDFVSHDYDLRRLVTAIVSSQGYQRSSRWHSNELPDESLFAVARLRPLSRRQFSFSLLLATGNARLEAPDSLQQRVEQYVDRPGLKRIEQYLAIEQQCETLAPHFDPRQADFQTSVTEALFISNNPQFQGLVRATDQNLAGKLSEVDDERELVARAVRSILSREPGEDELSTLADWLVRQGDDRRAACELLVWTFVSSAEFRFNH